MNTQYQNFGEFLQRKLTEKQITLRKMAEMIGIKAEQTVEFFSHIYGKAPYADAIRLLMGSQFWYFRQLLDQHMEEGRMLTCLQAVLDFTNAGCRQLCDTLQ